MDFGVCECKQCVRLIGIVVHFSHTHFISHQRIEKKNGPTLCGCVFLRANQSGIFKRFVKKGRAITRTMIRTKTTQTCVKTWHRESHWQKMLIGCIFFLNWKKRFPKRSLNLAVVLVCTSFYGESVDP